MRRPGPTTIVLDLSSSMTGRPWEIAVEAAGVIVADQPRGDALRIIGFEDTAKDLGHVTGGDGPGLEALLATTAVGGRSNLSAGVLRALCVSTDGFHRARSVVVVSDGGANFGVTDPGVLARLIGRAAAMSSTVSTICVGEDDADLLSAVAASGGGTAESIPCGRRAPAADSRHDDLVELRFSRERARARRLDNLVPGSRTQVAGSDGLP